MGLGGFEPPTSPLSGVRSNQLSYRPGIHRPGLHPVVPLVTAVAADLGMFFYAGSDEFVWGLAPTRPLFKEVIQPQVPLRLPCYDFTPVMNHTVVIVLPKVRLTTSGAAHSHGVTGGVYKARERIHRDILIRDY